MDSHQSGATSSAPTNLIKASLLLPVPMLPISVDSITKWNTACELPPPTQAFDQTDQMCLVPAGRMIKLSSCYTSVT